MCHCLLQTRDPTRPARQRIGEPASGQDHKTQQQTETERKPVVGGRNPHHGPGSETACVRFERTGDQHHHIPCAPAHVLDRRAPERALGLRDDRGKFVRRSVDLGKGPFVGGVGFRSFEAARWIRHPIGARCDLTLRRSDVYRLAKKPRSLL